MNSKKIFKTENIRLVNPNLGHPQFIQINSEKKEQLIEFQMLLTCNIHNIDQLKKFLEINLSVVPIIEYKWKLQKIMEEKKRKMQTIWGHIKKIFTQKSPKEEDITKKLNKLEPRGYRCEPISVRINRIEQKSKLKIDELAFLENEYCYPQYYLQEWNVFNDFNYYFCINASFFLSKEICDYFKGNKFVMFDINLTNSHINYHSLILTAQKWKDFTFFQITDTHLAERNDKIFEIVSKWKSESLDENVGTFLGDLADMIKNIFKKESNKEDLNKHEAKILNKSFEKRFINPNNQLRKAIKIINKKVLANELDFVIITGDLVDFVIKSEYSENTDDLNQLDYDQTNWKLFKDIILNKQSNQQYQGIIESQELLCPLFTIVGNHDFRPHHYDLTWGGLYRKMGLNSSEASALNDLFSANPINSISKSNLALKWYLREINPSLDFSLTLGDIELIFLNSGSDSFKNLRDFLSGHPSVTGLEDIQIKYLENIINHKYNRNKKIILLIHGPPINIGKYKYFRKRLQELGKPSIKKKIDDFKESILKKIGKETGSTRIDQIFNVKYGTVSSNWEKLIQFCKQYTLLALSGHTHVLKEFRLGEPKEKSTVYDAPPFILRKIENPAAVYYDVYSEQYDNPEDIKKNGPFILQTPSLGLGSYKKPEIVGAYRVIKIEKENLSSFKIEFLD